MKLREFINDLQEFEGSEMDFDVEVNLMLDNDEDVNYIDSIESKVYGKILLNVDLRDYILIEKSRLVELEESEYLLNDIQSHQ